MVKQTKKKTKTNTNISFSNGFMILLFMVVFIFMVVEVLIYKTTIHLPYVNNNLIKSDSGSTPSIAEKEQELTLNNFNPVAVLSSPLVINGEVKSNWMFEGSFKLSLIDSNNKVLANTVAREIVPGSWTQFEKVRFEAVLNFKPTTGHATLVFENDNPSGLKENAKKQEIPVKLDLKASENWQQYENKVYQISFKYPKDWLIIEKPLTSSNNAPDILLRSPNFSNSPNKCSVSDVFVEIHLRQSKNNKISFNKFVENSTVASNEMGLHGPITQRNLLSNNKILQTKDSGLLSSCNGPAYFIEQSQNRYTLIKTGFGNSSFQNSIDKILATITFIN